MKRLLLILLAVCCVSLCGCEVAGGGEHNELWWSDDCARTWANDTMTVQVYEWFRSSGCAFSWSEWSREEQLCISGAVPGYGNTAMVYFINENNGREVVLSLTAKVLDEQLILHVERDYGYEAGYYTVDHTGMDIVLDEQSRIY